MGLVHYRRYFVRDLYDRELKDEILTESQTDALLERYGILLPKPAYKLA